MSANEQTIARANNPFGSAPVVASPQMGASAQALIAREAQNIQVQMMMARHFPRDVVRSVDKIINAFARPELCEDALYAYSRGGTNISGLSIRAAEVLMQNWGNIRAGIDELARSNGQSEFLVYAQDLETGTIDEKKFFVRHWRDTKQGGKPVTDERDIYELGANFGARRKRACILAVIPKDVQAAAEHQIEITLQAKAEVTPEALKALLEAFGKFGVTKEMIEKRIQRHIDAMLPAQLINMRRIYASLKDGMSSADEWFEVSCPATAEQTQTGATQTDAVKERLRGKQGTAKASASSTSANDGVIPHFDEALALAEIRKAATLKELEAVYAPIVEDFIKTNREMPVAVEGAYGDRKAALEQAQS